MKDSATTGGGQPPPAAYSDPDWKNTVETGEPYEFHRFQRSPKARKRHERDERLLRDFLLTLPAGQLVLDAPSGQGRFSEVIQKSGHKVVAMEINFGRVRDACQRSNGQVLGIQGDVLHVPCADKAFAVGVCFRLLHHLTPEAVQQVLKEFRRVSQRAFVTFYNKHSWNYYRQRLEGKTPHRNYYPRHLLEQWCQQAGWRVDQVRPAWDFFHNLHALWLK
jgi:ubiquinone/menaquinone biosynthesis C-methylase UbiE